MPDYSIDTPRRELPAWLLRLLFKPATDQTPLQAAHERARARAIEAAKQTKRRTPKP